jgi:2'-5' RNA ligase
MIRLFVALPVVDMIRSQLAIYQNGLPGVRWTDPDGFHITLRFIGDVDHGTAEDLADMLLQVKASKCEVIIENLDWFGNKRRPGTLIANVQKNEALQHLQKKIESVAVRCGFRPESRKFHPHVTLGRLKTTRLDEVERYIAERRLIQPLAFDAERFVLYSSFLAHTGPVYTPEVDYPLDQAAYAAAE